MRGITGRAAGRGAAAAVLVICGALLVGSCGSTGATGTTGGRAAKPGGTDHTSTSGTASGSGASPRQVLQHALAAATASGAAHVTLHGESQGGFLTFDGDAGPASGDVTITTSTDDVDALAKNGVAYVKGNAAGLEEALHLAPSVGARFAGRWISIGSGTAPYAAVTALLLLGGILADVTPSGSLKETSGNFEGHAAIDITGVIQGSPGTMFLSAGGAHLPLGVEDGTKAAPATVQFSDWGEPVDVTVPSGSVAYSSLPGTAASS